MKLLKAFLQAILCLVLCVAVPYFLFLIPYILIILGAIIILSVLTAVIYFEDN